MVDEIARDRRHVHELPRKTALRFIEYGAAAAFAVFGLLLIAGGARGM